MLTIDNVCHNCATCEPFQLNTSHVPFLLRNTLSSSTCSYCYVRARYYLVRVLSTSLYRPLTILTTLLSPPLDCTCPRQQQHSSPLTSLSTSKELPTFRRRAFLSSFGQLFFLNCLDHEYEGNRSSPFWEVTQRRLVVIYRRFGTTYRSHLQGSSSPRRMPGTMRCAVI